MVGGGHRNLKRRALGTLTLGATVFCCVSGGPFGLEGLVGEAGPGLALILILIIPLLWALPDALTSAELGAALPREGGYVVWVKRALGPFWGFVNAWWTWMYSMVDIAIYPVLFTTYLGAILRLNFGWSILDAEHGNDWLRWGVCVTVVATFTWLNVRGTRLVGLTGLGFAALIILPFVLMAIVGGFQLLSSPRQVVESLTPVGKSLSEAIASGLGIVMWNYLGWDQMSTVAEEVDDPAKAYPRALLLGVPLVTLIYFVPTAVGLAFVPDASQWVEGAWPTIANAVGGPILSGLITVAGLISPMALFMSSMLATSRIPMVLAEDGYLPARLMEIHPVWGTPWRAVLLQGSINALLTYRTFQDLVAVNVVLYGAALALEQSSLWILRKREPDLPRPFRVPGGWPVLALIVAMPVSLVCLLVVLSIRSEGWPAQWLTFLLILSGPAIYWLRKVSIRKKAT